MKPIKPWLACLLFPLLLLTHALAGAQVVQTEHVRAELLVYAPDGIGPGKPLWLGLQLQHQPPWHSYWKNPGDAGTPTSLAWVLPAGWSAGQIQWPVPSRIPVGRLASIGYGGELLLPVPVKVGSALKAGAEIRLNADWLVCSESCVPESGEFRLKLSAGPQRQHAQRFKAALARVPKPVEARQSRAWAQAGSLLLQASGLPQREFSDAFLEEEGVVRPAARPRLSWHGDTLQVSMELERPQTARPRQMRLVLADAQGGLVLGFTLQGDWP
ncbi:protein-disulfide reductase DsbD domain-containing protein [Burkholderiaceae bacterium UC74_6]